MRDALRKDVAAFGMVSTQGVDELRVLMHQKVPGSAHDAIGLKNDAADAEAICEAAKPHANPPEVSIGYQFLTSRPHLPICRSS
jgi:hypothetical protein